jgi:hypothetical protein
MASERKRNDRVDGLDGVAGVYVCLCTYLSGHQMSVSTLHDDNNNNREARDFGSLEQIHKQGKTNSKQRLSQQAIADDD